MKPSNKHDFSAATFNRLKKVQLKEDESREVYVKLISSMTNQKRKIPFYKRTFIPSLLLVFLILIGAAVAPTFFIGKGEDEIPSGTIVEGTINFENSYFPTLEELGIFIEQRQNSWILTGEKGKYFGNLEILVSPEHFKHMVTSTPYIEISNIEDPPFSTTYMLEHFKSNNIIQIIHYFFEYDSQYFHLQLYVTEIPSPMQEKSLNILEEFQREILSSFNSNKVTSN